MPTSAGFARSHKPLGSGSLSLPPLDGFDFVCFRPKLIVEVDGGQHAESASDAGRDAHFRQNGFAVLRFWNDDVIGNIDGVCREILAAAGKGR